MALLEDTTNLDLKPTCYTCHRIRLSPVFYGAKQRNLSPEMKLPAWHLVGLVPLSIYINQHLKGGLSIRNGSGRGQSTGGRMDSSGSFPVLGFVDAALEELGGH